MAKSPAARHARVCRGCQASLEGTHIGRVWCLACLAIRTNRACAARSRALTRSRGAKPGRKIVDHTGAITCRSCRKEFGATWHTRRPVFCPTCRGGRIVEMNRRDRAQRRSKGP